MAAAAIVAAAGSSAEAYTVYYDNTETGWTQPKIYYWNPNWTEAQKPSWPGVNMTAYTANPKLSDIWTYEVDDEVTGIIFNNGTTQSKDYMGNKESFADKVFGFAEKGSSTSVSDVILGDIGSYIQSGGTTGENIDYSVHFHNKNAWNNVYVRITGNSNVSGGKMEAFLNGAIYDYEFQAPENASLNCCFYTLNGNQESNTTATWRLVNGHVYTESGDKGLNSEYDPVNTLPEKEYWLEPEMPSQLQEATLWFNKAYTAESNLRNTDEIYLWTGLISKGGDDKSWFGTPAEWNSMTDKYKMVRDESNPNLYKITFTPSIASWFGGSDDDRFTKLGFIFRDKSGNIKQHKDDQFI
ncbi:MAG: starch-binding protein, partial [Muribaculaceae bacterium]|nr:starch-binding protein [Muribaculaceae bacterium]